MMLDTVRHAAWVIDTDYAITCIRRLTLEGLFGGA